jgi:RHS repeat-associated protein
MDNGAIFHYIYDASGERVLKGRSNGQTAYVNGENKGGSGNMGNFTVYVNPYLVLKSGGYTKHYYIEGQRIVSKLGGGIDNNGKGPLKAGEGKVDYNGKQQKIRDGIVKNLKFLGLDGSILTAGKSGKIPPGQLNTKTQGGGKTDTETFQYFYHPDHLGSTSYITDASGEVYQHLEYFAFGETFVEEHSNTERTPYLYNGKELDEETGLYYYGARYYDPRTSLWQSVDPLAGRYPSWSPYNFTLNNPLTFIDPDGRKVVFAKGASEEFKKQFAAAVQYLNENKLSGMLAELEKSDIVYTIQEGNNRGSFDPNTNTITWDPTMGVLTNEGVVLSPTTVLNHEIDHALEEEKNPAGKKVAKATKDPDYDNLEEKRVIQGSEQKTAKKLGEIKEGEVTRKDHGGIPYTVKGPTSTEGLHEVIITPTTEEN